MIFGFFISAFICVYLRYLRSELRRIPEGRADLLVWDIVEQKVPVLKAEAEKLLGESAPE